MEMKDQARNHEKTWMQGYGVAQRQGQSDARFPTDKNDRGSLEG